MGTLPGEGHATIRNAKAFTSCRLRACSRPPRTDKLKPSEHLVHLALALIAQDEAARSCLTGHLARCTSDYLMKHRLGI